MNKAEALKLAKHRWGKNACIEENKKALTPEQREVSRTRNKEIVDLLAKNQAERNTIPAYWPQLVKAARAVMNARGFNNTLEKLVEPLERAERTQELIAEYSKLRKEQQALCLHVYRWSAGYATEKPIRLFHIHEQADTLEDLAKRIKEGTLK